MLGDQRWVIDDVMDQQIHHERNRISFATFESAFLGDSIFRARLKVANTALRTKACSWQRHVKQNTLWGSKILPTIQAFCMCTCYSMQ